MMSTWVLVSLTTLGAAGVGQYRTSSDAAQRMEARVRENQRDKGRLLVANQALALRVLAVENAFSDVRELVTQTARQDRDVLYGTFVDGASLPWIAVTPRTPAAGVAGHDADAFLREIGVPAAHTATSLPQTRAVVAFGAHVEEYSADVFDGADYLGTIRYGISMAGTELLLRQELSGARRSLLRLLGLLGILGASGVVLGVFAIRRMAHRITEPLSSLARASSELAQGNRSVRVSISSGDELEQLAETFNAMADANERAMRDLEVKTAEALESSRLKSEFLANMSHEIRTPMNGILGVARLARSLPLEGKLRRYVETIDSSASSLMTIINDVLDFSKMEAGKYSLNPVIFDLRTVVQEVCELLATRASDKGLDLIWHIDPTMASLHRGDPDRLRQIISNLVGNAIKFTDRGEVRVDVSVVERRTEGERLRIAIIDTGIGIAKADIPKLFDSFSQLDGSMSRKFGGTGLGLAISKRLVEMMGGTMGVASELGRGSEFSCELRLETAAAGPQDSRAPVGGLPAIAAPPGLPALVSARVLVVDDNEVNLFVAVEMLEQMGYQVETAKNGAEAVEMAQRGDFAVILMDCQMPVMDGYAATREIRRAEEGTGAHQTILALTAHALSGERERVLSAGMDDYLSKPVRPSSLDKMIRRHARAGARAVPQESAASAAPQKASLDTTISRSGKLIDLFLKNIPGQLDAIEGAARSGQAADLRAHAHKAKGSCLALGAATMAHTAETLQKLAETGSVDGSLHLVAAMRQQYVEVAGLLARERARS